MATRTANNKTYYINPAYLTFVENSGYGANLIQVSASSSCYISVYDPANGINYSDADKNYLRWKVTAYNNKFPDNEAWKIYVRLERDGSSALVMYDHDELGIHGGKIEEKTDEQGNVTKVEGEYDPNHPYWYIRIGDVSATNGTTIREITYDTGYLVSDRGLNDANDLNDMWELDKYSTPWLIRAKQWLSDFTVKGFVTLIGGLVFKKGDVEKPVVDIKRSTDDDVPVDDTTIPTTAYVRSISDDRYLKKYEEDETNYRIRFYDGIEAGHFVKGMIGGSGTQFDGRGYGEMNGLTLREFLEVPELRFNRIDVVSGELWNSIAFGLVESVDTGRRICRIKLEGKERCGLHVYDICRGIFADFGDGTQWEGVDECGFLHLYGFWTSYFTPTKILENGDGVFSFQYELKAGTTQHPCQSMKFAVYGNFVDSSRQASAYSTRTYKRYLNKVDTWVIDPDKHIYAQYGDLEGLTVGGMHMHGYGSFQSNSYFTGVQIQFTPQQKLELQGESAYSVILSDYEGVVIIDDEGNVIGGETEMLNVVSDGMNVTSSGDNVVTSFYKLRTEVQAMRGSTPLFHSPSTPSEGAYAIAINTVGCTAVVINGVVAVTSVFHTERCYVDIVVNCEGKATFSLRYNINAVRDGKNPVIADIDNEMDSVACDSEGKVLFGLPVSCTVSMWAGVKKLVLDRLVLELPDGVTATSDRSTGLVTVTGITDEAERTLPVNITAYATHGGNQYHKELVFTVNKVNAGENALLYKLSPSASSVKVDDEGNMTASSISCEVVASDGRRIEPLEELPQGVTMEFFRDDEVAGTYSYKTPVSINDGNKTVTFRLLVEGKLVDVETIPILLDGSSPVSLDLDNEMFSVACDAGGDVTFMPEMVTRATMYWGSKPLATEVTSVESKEGAVSSFVGDTVTVTSVPEGKDTPDTFRIAVSAKAAHGGTEYTRTAYLTVNKVRQGDSAWVLDLMPSVSAVKVNNKGVYSPISVSCRTRMTTGKEVSVPAALQDNYTMRYSVDGGSEKSYSYGDEVAVSPEYDKNITALSTDVTFYLYHSEDNGKEKPWVMVDKETIPILMDAADAFKSTVFIRTNDVPDTPTGGSYESPVPGDTAWSDGIPAGEEILWASTRTFTSDGKEPQDDVWSTPAQMTDTASFDVEFSSVENPNPPTGHPNTNTQWTGDASEDTIWMATSSMKNGEWGDWQILKIKGEKGEFGDLTDEEKDSLKAQYYTIEASVGSIGYTMTGGYSPSSFIWSEYSIKGSSKTASNVNYARVYGKKGDNPKVQLGSRYTNVRNQTFNAASYKSADYDVFIFELEDLSGNLIHSTSVSVGKQGETGEDGSAGVMLRYCGLYESGVTYEYNDEYRDVVISNGFVYQVWAKGSSVTTAPSTTITEGNNDGYWEMANKQKFVAMDTALIDNANIAGFTFIREGYDDNGAPVGTIRSQSSNSYVSHSNNGTWIEDSGFRKSPEIGNGEFTREIVTFTVTEKCIVLIEMIASSEANYDIGFVGEVDRSYVTTQTNSDGTKTDILNNSIKTENLLAVSGTQSGMARIESEPGTYSVEIIYRKDSSGTRNEDCVRYRFVGSPKLWISSHTGTLSCSDVYLTGVINANSGTFNNVNIESGIIGDWKIADGTMSTEGTYYGDWANSPFKNTLDVSGMQVSINSDDITARFGVKKVTFSEDGYDYFCSTLDIVNAQASGSRRTDPMCGIHIKGNKNDLGLFIEGTGIYISPESGAYSRVKGLGLNARVVSTTTTLSTNDDIVIVSNNATVTLPSAGVCAGKIYIVKILSGTLKVNGVYMSNSSSVTSSGSWTDSSARMFVSANGYWVEFLGA